MAPTEFLSVLPYVAAAGVFAGLYLLRRHVRGQDCRSDARLDGKTAIVTGANSGIGRAAAQELAARGARVILACRDMTKAETAASDIRQATGNGNVVAGKLDLSSLASVREFADHVNREEERLDILINNAGVMWCPKQYTADGFELQFGVNHLGHFLLTHLLLDLLTCSAPSRVVTVSAVGHAHANIDFDNLNGEKSYSPFQANFQSKLANALFSRELARRTRGTGVTALSLDPGPVRTDIARHMPTTLGPVLYAPFWLVMQLIQPIVKTPRQGAQTVVHCAVAEGLEECSGMYFSNCAPAEPAPQAKDDAVAKRLWEVSEAMVGIRS
ncbi:retinol dehydrogenase 12-like [Branchiostoma floridae]|uniref:Retinol dehydrogenase 12-like n=1 Tax=Branchiostoma floridae TaxID=7739 RepID=A0A9J7N591_BRAFL|nr:retinol dehydrogenase 12-like [Branchiostoma floridae]